MISEPLLLGRPRRRRHLAGIPERCPGGIQGNDSAFGMFFRGGGVRVCVVSGGSRGPRRTGPGPPSGDAKTIAALRHHHGIRIAQRQIKRVGPGAVDNDCRSKKGIEEWTHGWMRRPNT